MATKQIYFWHGRDKAFEAKIAKFCRHNAEDDQYYWDGTLDEFQVAYGGKFIVYPDQICVTPFSNFGQR